MLAGQTRPIMVSKLTMVVTSMVLLLMLVVTVPELNGALAGLTAAVGAPIELTVLYASLRRLERKQQALVVQHAGPAL